MLRAIAVLVLVGGWEAAQEADLAKKDLEALQGEWMMAAMEANGQEVAPDRLRDTVLVVKGDVYRIKVKGKDTPAMTIKLMPKKRLSEIDMVAQDGVNKDKVHKGIYEVTKDTIKICRGLTPEQERPVQFGSWPNTNIFVVTWKRVK
jgi:uncharacterized protein (TIGR03067 family)